MTPKKLTGKERADVQFSSKRIQTTTTENNLAASMSYQRHPSLYGDGNGEIGPLENGFSACKAHAQWIKDVESFKNRHTTMLKNLIKGLWGNLSPSAGVNGLAKLLLTDIVAQWNEIVSFIDIFFQELTETSKFPKDKASRLVGQCCGSIFDAMVPYCATV